MTFYFRRRILYSRILSFCVKMIDRKRVILYIMSCVQQEHKTIRNARVAQLVERDLAKVEAAGSSPVSRSFYFIAETFSFS